jgi:hypothetical protein
MGIDGTPAEAVAVPQRTKCLALDMDGAHHLYPSVSPSVRQILSLSVCPSS